MIGMFHRGRFGAASAVALALTLVLAGCNGGSGPTLRPPSPRPPTPPPSTTEVELLISSVAGGVLTDGLLDEFWVNAVGELTGSPTYRRPSQIRYYVPGQPIDTACTGDEAGTGAKWNQNAYYCPTDETVSWERMWFSAMYDDLGALAPVAVMAHEWGHHIQRLTSKPSAKLSIENQSDCYSGAFFRYVDDENLLTEYVTEGTSRAGVAAIYLLGNADFVASEWYSDYGPPRSRQLAFGLGSLALSPSMCELFATYEYQSPLVLGWYTLDPPPSFAVSDRAGIKVLTHGDVSAEVKVLPDLTDEPAAAQLEGVAATWLGTSNFTWVNDVYPNPFTARFGGTSAIRTYEQQLPNADGTTRTIHGDLVLQADAGHGGILIDVYRPGPAPTGSLDELTQWAAIFANGLCPGGTGTDMCPTEGGR